MAEIFLGMLLGHLAGDYLFQSKKMALKKSEKGWYGLAWCVLHCLIYTACVCAFLRTLNALVWALVFLSHFPIDRWSLGHWWLKMIRGRDILKAYETENKYREIDLAFSCIVYVVVDNTLHLILLWLVALLIINPL